MTVFTLSWGTSELGFARQEFLVYQMIGVLFFAATIPLSAVLADRVGRMPMLIADDACDPRVRVRARSLLRARTTRCASPRASRSASRAWGSRMAPLGTALAELFPTAVRYTGASIAFNVAGILGGSLAPYVATWLAKNYGIAAVGYYLSVAAAITLAALVAIQSRERARSGAAARETLPGML